MPCTLTCDLWVYTSAQQICQVSMPQSMECYRADTGPLDDLRKCMREVPGTDGRTIEPGKHKIILIASEAQGNAFFKLTDLVRPQGLDD